LTLVEYQAKRQRSLLSVAAGGDLSTTSIIDHKALTMYCQVRRRLSRLIKERGDCSQERNQDKSREHGGHLAGHAVMNDAETMFCPMCNHTTTNLEHAMKAELR